MNEEKVKAYKIVNQQFLTLIRIELLRGSDSPLEQILGVVRGRNIPIRFLASDRSSEGELTLCLGVDLLSEETVGDLIDKLGALQNRKDLALISQVSMAMIYGPHFGESPGIFGLTFSALTRAGINPLAISASSSSLSFLFPSVEFKGAIETLQVIFELPQPNLFWQDYDSEF